MLTNLYVMAQTKAILFKNKVASFFKDEKGEVNIIAIIVILAIALALAVIFRNQIVKLFDQIWDGIWGDANNQDYNGSYS